MRDKKWIIEVWKDDKVVRQSDIVLACHWMQVLETRVYKDMKKTLVDGERINYRLVRKDEVMAL